MPEAYHTKLFYSEKAASDSSCLSMLIGPDSFMYALSSNNFRNITELCHVEINHSKTAATSRVDHLAYLFNNHQLIEKRFTSIQVAVLNTEFTLVPEAYAVAGTLKPLLDFTTGNGNSKTQLSHHVKNIQFCYALQSDLSSYLERTFPNASIRHAGAVSISLLFSHHSLINNNLFLQIGDSSIQITAKKNNDLLFYNVFAIESNEDVLYYLLFMMEQFALDPLSARLVIAAERPVEDPLIKSIQKYVKQVDFCVTDPSVRLRGELLSLPQHYYFTLLNQYLCEL